MTAKAVLDWKVLDTLLQFKVTLKFVAHELGVSPNTIQRHIKEQKNGMTFEEYHDIKLKRTGVKLQQKAIEMAIKGDRTMLIFCLKNISGWADKQETSISEDTIKAARSFIVEKYDEQNKVISETV